MSTPGKRGRLSPEVIDELMQFIDSQAGSEPEMGGEGLPEDAPAAPAVEVEIESKPKGMEPGGKTCPTCGHTM